MQNVDNLIQIDSSKPIIDYYNKYKSKTKCVGDNEIPHFIRNDKKGMSLRTPERCVAIPLLTTTQKVITSLPLAGVVIAY